MRPLALLFLWSLVGCAESPGVDVPGAAYLPDAGPGDGPPAGQDPQHTASGRLSRSSATDCEVWSTSTPPARSTQAPRARFASSGS